MITEVLRYSAVVLVIAYAMLVALALKHESAALHYAAFLTSIAAIIICTFFALRLGYEEAIKDVRSGVVRK